MKINSFLSNAITLLYLAIVTPVAFAQTIVTDGEDLSDAVNAAQPGDTIIVANGSYHDFEASFEVSGTPEDPIVVKAEVIGGVTLTGESHFVLKKSAYVIIEGFIFDAEGENTLIKLEGSNNIRITRNVFELETIESIKWVYIGGLWDDKTFQYPSHHNRIDHNIFQNKTTPGHYITIDGTSNEDEQDYRQSQYDRIDHNYFKNNAPRAANEQESIRIGWSEMSMSSGYTIVEHNLFENCDGDPEIISVKSSDNIIRYNTIRNSYGTLSLRHGNRNRVEGNYFFGGDKPNGTFETSTIYTGGIRIYGTDHVIINNYMEGLKGTIWDAPIALTQGDAIDGSSTDFSKHFRAERVTIAYNTLVNNTFGIEIGFDNKGNYNKELKDITIANNIVVGSENNLVRFLNGNNQSGEITWLNNVMHPVGDASLVSGGYEFSIDEVMVSNPNLSFTDSIWRATEDTPVLTNGVPFIQFTEDIEGQTRPEQSSVGADHYSSDLVRFAPVTPEQVGPFAYEEDEETLEILYLSSIIDFDSKSDSQTVSITSNLDWIASTGNDWITLSSASGSGNGSIIISVQANTVQDQRTGTVTFEGGSLSSELTITQKGLSTQADAEKVEIVSVSASSEQTPDNVKENVLDGDLGTRWSAEGIGEYLTFDLGELYTIEVVKIAVYNGTERYTYFDIATSEDGNNFTNQLEDLTNSMTTNELEDYKFKADAQFVRIIGNGNSTSEWNSITEVEIYGTKAFTTSTKTENKELTSFQLAGNYPNPFNPTTSILFESPQQVQYTLMVYSVTGQQTKKISGTVSAGMSYIRVDLSESPSGVYFYQLRTRKNNAEQFIGYGKMTLIK